MIYLYGALGTAIIGFLAWVYKLIQNNETLKQIVASKQVQSQIKEWADKIEAQEGKVNEDVKDFNSVADAFNVKYPDNKSDGTK